MTSETNMERFSLSLDEKDKKSRRKFDFSIETLMKYTHLRQDDAAHALGVAHITLKRICHRHKFRWPYRTIKALHRQAVKRQTSKRHQRSCMKTKIQQSNIIFKKEGNYSRYTPMDRIGSRYILKPIRKLPTTSNNPKQHGIVTLPNKFPSPEIPPYSLLHKRPYVPQYGKVKYNCQEISINHQHTQHAYSHRICIFTNQKTL